VAAHGRAGPGRATSTARHPQAFTGALLETPGLGDDADSERLPDPPSDSALDGVRDAAPVADKTS